MCFSAVERITAELSGFYWEKELRDETSTGTFRYGYRSVSELFELPYESKYLGGV